MKILRLFVLIGFVTPYLFGQEIDQQGFDSINAEIKQTISTIHSSDEFDVLIEAFNLNPTEAAKVEELQSATEVTFSKAKDTKSYIFPVYFHADTTNVLQLTLYAFTVEPQRSGESFSRAKYYFILTTIVDYSKNRLVFKDSKVITEDRLINQWFLGGFQTYLEKTKPIFERYNFTPPPPPLPPNTLKLRGNK
jgi:hypothetical protein